MRSSAESGSLRAEAERYSKTGFFIDAQAEHRFSEWKSSFLEACVPESTGMRGALGFVTTANNRND
jgi:hypothetical protein